MALCAIFLLQCCTRENVLGQQGLQTRQNQTEYQIFLGNTHSHCNYSGDILKKAETNGEPVDPNNVPEMMFRQAKACGYDFYAITDHSQYEVYTPEAFADIRQWAKKSTDAQFVAICGFEFSRNQNTDGKGHINVYNTPDFISAENLGMQNLQQWLTHTANQDGIACFNHPEPQAYHNFECYEEAVRRQFALIELINSNNTKSYYDQFLLALSKGWRVSPVAGCDNHKFQNIKAWKARTGIAATELTYEAIMEAFQARRTYATFDKNLKIIYYVDSYPMGSVIQSRNKNLHFDIRMSTQGQHIAKVEILGEQGRTVQSKEFATDHITWEIEIPSTERYYFLRVYEEGIEEPIAWVAPVWIQK